MKIIRNFVDISSPYNSYCLQPVFPSQMILKWNYILEKETAHYG